MYTAWKQVKRAGCLENLSLTSTAKTQHISPLLKPFRHKFKLRTSGVHNSFGTFTVQMPIVNQVNLEFKTNSVPIQMPP